MLANNQILEGEIDSIAFGGEGILRYREFVIFVPFTAVGDRISCRITKVKKNYAKGQLVSLKRTSKERVEPKCPHFGVCGGCQLQHMSDKDQSRYKLNTVKESLERIGRLSCPPFHLAPSSENWAYRRHITLQLKPAEASFSAGYIGIDGSSLVPIQDCPIFNHPHDSILTVVHHLAAKIANPNRRAGRVTILKNHEQRYILFFRFAHPIKINQNIFQATLVQCPQIAGILIKSADQEIIVGDPFCKQEMEDLEFRFSPEVFIQNHPEQSKAIYRKICDIVAQTKFHSILDLYCGVGILSLLLAKDGRKVIGVESNKRAVEQAIDNAASNHVKTASFICARVEEALADCSEKTPPDLVILNPPRQGLSKGIMEKILNIQPKSMIYVSCMPPTLARDLKFLSSKYHVKEGHVYDMFPQTAHVETLVLLQ